jgi:hypothetical protein
MGAAPICAGACFSSYRWQGVTLLGYCIGCSWSGTRTHPQDQTEALLVLFYNM